MHCVLPTNFTAEIVWQLKSGDHSMAKASICQHLPSNKKLCALLVWNLSDDLLCNMGGWDATQKRTIPSRKAWKHLLHSKMIKHLLLDIMWLTWKVSLWQNDDEIVADNSADVIEDSQSGSMLGDDFGNLHDDYTVKGEPLKLLTMQLKRCPVILSIIYRYCSPLSFLNYKIMPWWDVLGHSRIWQVSQFRISYPASIQEFLRTPYYYNVMRGTNFDSLCLTLVRQSSHIIWWEEKNK